MNEDCVSEYCIRHGNQDFFPTDEGLCCPVCHPNHEDNPNVKHPNVSTELIEAYLTMLQRKVGLKVRVWFLYWNGNESEGIMTSKAVTLNSSMVESYVEGFLEGFKAGRK
jgi:hypothetical protein